MSTEQRAREGSKVPRRLRRRRGESGQAVVEAALTLPVQLFVLLGTIQLTLVYHARFLTELSAYKAARAASLFRVDCAPMVRAALIPLIPSLGGSQGAAGTNGQDVATRFNGVANQVLVAAPNRPPSSGKNVPVVILHYRLERNHPDFDHQVNPGEPPPSRITVRVAYFYEYRIPFVNALMTRFWLATHTAAAWNAGYDPLNPTGGVTTTTPTAATNDATLLTPTSAAIAQQYYTTPVVASWTMRMMSDPQSTVPANGLGVCQ